MNKKGNSDEFKSVGEAIRGLLNSYHLQSKFDEVNIVNSWERLVGKPIASRTRKVYIRNKVLYAEFDSPSMKHDFMLHKNEILNIFGKEFGQGVISEIIVL